MSIYIPDPVAKRLPMYYRYLKETENRLTILQMPEYLKTVSVQRQDLHLKRMARL